MLLAALADIDEDRATGKLDDDDYEQLRSDLSARAIDVMRKMDQLAERPDPPALGPRPVDTPGDGPA